jgi:SAM-dependent methyltransferase
VSPRATSDPAFWDARYRLDAPPFGTAPSPFLVEQAHRLPPGADVLDLGAGDGRNALWLAAQGHRATALDFSAAGLEAAAAAARRARLDVALVEANLGAWKPERAWDALVCFFVHLLPAERAAFFQNVVRALRPGGVLIAEWFCPANVALGGPGPSTPDRLVGAAEVRAALTEGTLLHCEEGRRVLDEGTFLRGPAATLRVVFQRGDAAAWPARPVSDPPVRA